MPFFLSFCYQNTQSISATDPQVPENKITGKKIPSQKDVPRDL